MNETAANLLWHRRYRGLVPAALRSVSDTGRALLIRPDEYEPRTYQVLTVEVGGDPAELGAVSVEKIRKFETIPDGRMMLGMTNDDLYIFREGRKTRFLAERGCSFADVALAPGPGWFVCGFSDPLSTHHSLAFGDANARLGWTRELDQPVNRVAIAGDGRVLAVGFPSGRTIALDNLRNPVWGFVHEEPVTGLALGESGAACVIGTEAGTLLAVNGEGALRWKVSVGLPVVGTATDDRARWVAAILSDGGSHALICLTETGAPLWEFDLEARPTGISLSPDGRYLLVSLATGVASLFQVDFTAVSAVPGLTRRPLALARAAASTGDLEAARVQYLAVLAAEPHDVETARELADLERILLCQYDEVARQQRASGNFEGALDVLDRALRVLPWDPALVAHRRDCCEEARAFWEAEAQEAMARYAWDAAERACGRVLQLDAGALHAREALAAIREHRAAALRTDGDTRAGAGDAAGAIACWQQAQKLEPRDDVAQRLRRMEAQRCVDQGIAHYEAQRMPEAVFQFRKALALDPHSEPAARYLGYAQGQAVDTQIADRFSRLE